MKNKLILLTIFLFSFLIISTQVFASTTNGTVTGYAWGENVGWVDFSKITVTDTTLSNSVYGENIGWIDLATITNDNEGNLSGYAWGENIGWVDFSNVTIGTDGIFTGAAYGENIGWITFGTTDNKVMTDWRPASTRTHHTSSGSYATGYIPNYIATPTTSTTTSSILNSGPCTSEQTLTDNLKVGARNGVYSTYNKGTVTQVKILQAHINRILASSYNQAAGPVDGIFGPLTKQGVERLQTALNTYLKPTPLLVIDGIVGPYTKAAINNSCGK